MQLNKNNEVADFVDVSQFLPGKSAYECVAYSASLIKFCGQPGHGAIGTPLQTSNLAQYWYGREEGSNTASNTNGMSLDAEYNMLKGMGLSYKPLEASIQAVHAALLSGYPVMLCGAETGMHDLALGDRVPYNWTPTGNHCIVASGIVSPSDGNLLVHDCANVDKNGVIRPGPRTYDASKMQIVSATAIIVPWIEEVTLLQLSDPMGKFFTASDDSHWHCANTNQPLSLGFLSFFRQYGGIIGLPLTSEFRLPQYPNATFQIFERSGLVYNPQHDFDSSPGLGDIFLLHLDKGPGQQIVAKPLLTALQAQVNDLTAQLDALKAQPAPDTSALEAQLSAYKGAVGQIEMALAPLPK